MLTQAASSNHPRTKHPTAAPIAKGARRSFLINATTAQMIPVNPNIVGKMKIPKRPPNRAKPAHTKAIIEKRLDAAVRFG